MSDYYTHTTPDGAVVLGGLKALADSAKSPMDAAAARQYPQRTRPGNEKFLTVQYSRDDFDGEQLPTCEVCGGDMGEVFWCVKGVWMCNTHKEEADDEKIRRM